MRNKHKDNISILMGIAQMGLYIQHKWVCASKPGQRYAIVISTKKHDTILVLFANALVKWMFVVLLVNNLNRSNRQPARLNCEHWVIVQTYGSVCHRLTWTANIGLLYRHTVQCATGSLELRTLGYCTDIRFSVSLLINVIFVS